MFNNSNINWIQAGGALVAILVFFAGKFGIVIPDEIKNDILVLIVALTAGGTAVVHNVVNVPANKQKAQDMLVQNGVSYTTAERMVKTLAMLAVLPLFLMGCASSAPPALPTTASDTAATPPAPNPNVDVLTQISQFTMNDLQTADADAVAHNDNIAHMCYPALEQFVASVPNLNGTVAGAFSLFQRGRDLRNMAAGGVPDYLLIGCGPLVAQVRGDILKLLTGVGAGAATGGLLP